jgi:hypothetical protein
MKTLFNSKYILLFSTLFIISCSKDTPEVVEEQELITTVELEFRAADETTQTIRWQVDQTNNQTVSLKANTAYEVSISFFDESDPADVEDITEEVREEADEHQVFYEFSNVSVSYTSGDLDTLDSEGNPVFIHSIWNASATGSGIIRAYLIHEPTTKSSTNRDGFGGETDVAVDIPITIIE